VIQGLFQIMTLNLDFLNLMFVDPCIIVQFLQKIQQDATVYQSFIIPYLNEAEHVSGNTPPIIRSLKLHKQPLVLHNIMEGCRTCSCWTLSGSARYLTASDNLPQYYAKPEVACAVLGSW